MQETSRVAAKMRAGMSAGAVVLEKAGLGLRGRYDLSCTDATGAVLWESAIDNTVVTVGQNELLAASLQGSSYTVTGPYIFLISSVGFSAIAATDTMASHPGWNEATGSTNTPNYSGNRPTATFGTPSGGSISTSGSLSFVFTNSGTIEGIGMVFGSGASDTPGNTSGTLLSAGTLGTPQPVISGNTVTATWTLSL